MERFLECKLPSVLEMLNEIASILQQRIEDNNVTARKDALIALENHMVFDRTYLNAENLKCFACSVKDPNIVIRKQMMQSLTVVLDAYRDHPEVQACWLKCILLMVQDPETTVQGKAVAELEEQFLRRIFSNSQDDRECAFSLLKMLASGDFLAHHRCLQKAFQIWKSEKKLKPKQANILAKYLDTQWEESVLFYLSNFAVHCSLPARVSQPYVERFVKFHYQQTFPEYMDYLLKLLNHSLKNMTHEKLDDIKNIISHSLKSFEVPVKWIPVYINILYKTHKQLQIEADFFAYSSQLIQLCEKNLTDIKETYSFDERPSEELLSKYFCIIKEICQLDYTKITKSNISLLKVFSACDTPPPELAKILTPTLRAHVFAALGKFCLQDEILAKELMNIFATELLTSSHDIIRNNLVIILIDMCKRYTSFAGKYIPLISLCIKDRLHLIRYQTIVLLVNLLQEGYIKWRGPLFFCLLSTLNDQKDEIQELGRYSLSQLLQDKNKTLFSEYFVDSIFVFCGFAPPDNESLAQTVKELERFALKGETKREERMLLYKFLLVSMDMKERAYLIKSVCEILTKIADGIYPMNATTECIIRDCFAILTCREIRALNVDQFSDDIHDKDVKDFIKVELETRKVVIVEPVVQAISSLQNSITDPESDMIKDMVCFLKDLLEDFKETIKDILSFDKKLLGLVMHELRSDAVRDRHERNKTSEEDPKSRQPLPDNQGENVMENSFTVDLLNSLATDALGEKPNNE